MGDFRDDLKAELTRAAQRPGRLRVARTRERLARHGVGVTAVVVALVLATVLVVGSARPGIGEHSAATTTLEQITPPTGGQLPTVVIFAASWCGPCQESIPAIWQLLRLPVHVRVVAYRDAIVDARAFAQALRARPHGIEVVRDTGGGLARRFGVRMVPEAFILGLDGRQVGPRWTGKLDERFVRRVKDAVRQQADTGEPASVQLRALGRTRVCLQAADGTPLLSRTLTPPGWTPVYRSSSLRLTFVGHLRFRVNGGTRPGGLAGAGMTARVTESYQYTITPSGVSRPRRPARWPCAS